MTDNAWFSVLTLSVGLPWIMGAALMLRLIAAPERRNLWLIAGHGYVIGLALTTLIIRLSDLIGFGPGLLPVLAIQGVLTLYLLFALWQQREAFLAGSERESPATAGWEKTLIALLLLFILLRLLTLTEDMLLRPLFAWDAWMNWVPKAIVYFHNGELSTYVSWEEWLTQPSDQLDYTLGNYSAWKYPITVPLIQYWGMVTSGSTDQSLIYLHWPLLLAALAIALYGHLRLVGMKALPALLCSYLLVSIPYGNVHATLVGYADLWLAGALGLGVFSLHAYCRFETRDYALLTVIYAIICTTLKLPGLVLGVILLATLVLAKLQLSLKTVAGIAAALIGTALLVFLVGVDVTLPGLGNLQLTFEKITVPHLGSFELSFHPVQSAFAESMFYSDNWNLLWPLFLLALLSLALSRNADRPETMVLVALLFLAVFLFVVFFLTHHYRTALQFTTMNRALLYAVPTMVLFMALRAQRQLTD